MGENRRFGSAPVWRYLKPYFPFALLAAFFMLGDAGADLIQPLLMAQIVDEGILDASSTGRLVLILKTGALMMLVALVGGAAGCLCNLFTHLASQKTGNLIRQECFERIMGLSFTQIEELGEGTLITRLTNDISQVQGLLAVFMRMLIRMLLFVIGSITLLFSLDTRFGLTALVACPLMALVIALCLGKASPLFDRLQARIDILNDIMQEDIAGIRTIKAYVREAREKQRFGRANDSLVATQLSTLLIFAFMNPSVSAIAYIAIACILSVGNVDVAAGSTQPGDVMAALSYALLLLQGTSMIVLLSQNISRGLASWKRIREILALKPDQIDGDVARGSASAPAVEMKDVTFSYPRAGKPALDKVNLSIGRGETVAILGPTGCGKSTLVSLIPRFYDADRGTVSVQGSPVASWDRSALRKEISFAFQKAELFSASAFENIAWAKPEATLEQVSAAARIAQAHDFILDMPQGYESPIAERGTSLSGGQRQRIALARIALSDAGIIILDDATSALDLKTEANFHRALAQAKPQACKIIVTQRIATALLADRIIVMNAGSVEDTGTHEQLYDRCETYRALYDSQIDGEEV